MAGKATGSVLLLVEDDDAIGRLVKQYLEQQAAGASSGSARARRRSLSFAGTPCGWSCSTSACPASTASRSAAGCARQSNVPIVMLTARDEEPDRVVGFELGADDYVPKPFSPRELAARIKRDPPPGRAAASQDAVLSAGEIVLRRDSHDVTVDGEAVQLTAKEFDLLTCFLEHQGIVLSRERLLDIVWGMSYPGGTRTVDMHVAQLRRKLGAAEAIRTVRGAGYKLLAT